jgi:FMN phosphatase YigB (HAD superfamily)
MSKIIFDYGGVISQGSRKEKIINSISKEFSIHTHDLEKIMSEELMIEVALGEMPISALYNKFKKLNVKITELFLESLFYNASKPQLEQKKLIEELSKTSNLYLISDSIPPFTKYIRDNFSNLFQEMFFSDEVGVRKINGLFQYVEQKHLSFFNNSIYIDDHKKYLIYPQSKGSTTILFTNYEKLIKSFTESGLSCTE